MPRLPEVSIGGDALFLQLRLLQQREEVMAAKRDQFLSHLERLNNRDELTQAEYNEFAADIVRDDTTFDAADQRIILQSLPRDAKAKTAYIEAIAKAEVFA